MRPVQLPAGLEDRNIEIYISDGKLKAICCGTVIPFDKLPESFIDGLSSVMINDRRAVKSMIQDMGIVIKECWDCGHRGSCPAEGKICSRIQGPNGLLTKRETEMFFMVLDGLQDKEIAARLDISINTVITMLKRIRERLGIQNRLEMMTYALKRRIITF